MGIWQLFTSVPSMYFELREIATECSGGELDWGSLHHLTSLRPHFIMFKETGQSQEKIFIIRFGVSLPPEKV